MTLHYAALIEEIGIFMVSDTAASIGGKRIASAQKINATGPGAIIAGAGNGPLVSRILREAFASLVSIEEASAFLKDAHYRYFEGHTASFLLAGRNQNGDFALDRLVADGAHLQSLPVPNRRSASIGQRCESFSAECNAWISRNIRSVVNLVGQLPSQFLVLSNNSRDTLFLSILASGVMALCKDISREQGIGRTVGGPWIVTVFPMDGSPIHQPSGKMYNGAKSIASFVHALSPRTF